MGIITTIIVVLVILFLIAGIRLVRPTHKGVIERFGKFNRLANQGFNWIIPAIDQIYYVNVTEQMVDADSQEVITEDNLNAVVNAQVYFKVRSTDQGVKDSQYNVDNYYGQIVSLSQTTLRNEIGKMLFKDVNSQRGKLNAQLQGSLQKETNSWGIDIVRTEIMEITPPEDVQHTMNEVIKAENTKQASRDFANATEIKADGVKRASIKEAEGSKEAQILRASGQAEAIKLKADADANAIQKVHTSAEKFFKGNAQKLKQLQVTENSLKDNAKIVLPQGEGLYNIIGDMSSDKAPALLKPKK